MRCLRIVPAIGFIAGGCAQAPVPPEQAERQRQMMAAIEPCKQKYPSVREVEIDEHGRIFAQGRWESAQWAGFKACASEALTRSAERRPFGAGKIAAGAATAKVTFKPAGSLMLVPVSVNGTEATFLLDTGSSVTLLRPSFAQRAGVALPSRAPTMSVGVGGGQRFQVPYVRVKSLRVGDAAVEGIDVGVLDSLVPPLRGGVDGVLGANYLNHFRITIDRQGRLITLEPH